jgi:5-methylcytosine-specific restriction endonuclease McrA
MTLAQKVSLIKNNKEFRKKWIRERKKHPKQKGIKQLAQETEKLSYKQFLQSEYWKRIKKEILKRDGYRCYFCKSNEFLQIHHTTYKYLRKEYKYRKTLMTVCEKCHNEIHCTMEIN